MNEKYVTTITLQIDRDLSELLAHNLTLEQARDIERIVAVHYYYIISRLNQLEGAHEKAKRTNAGTSSGVSDVPSRVPELAELARLEDRTLGTEGQQTGNG